MKFINNYNKTNDNQIDFELHNNNKLKVSFMNALRRVCIGLIELDGIDKSKTNIISNTSYVNNSMLKERLELSPIYKKDIYNNLKITLNVSNDNYEIRSIYLSDFKIVNKFSNKDEDIEIFVYPRILYSKLKYGENINLEAEFTRNNSFDGNSAFCAVSPMSYHFKRDETKVAEELKKIDDEHDKLDFNIRDSDRIFQINNKHEPEICVYTLESCGNISSHQVFKEGLSVLREKLSLFIII